MADTFITEAHLKEREKRNDSIDRAHETTKSVRFGKNTSPQPTRSTPARNEDDLQEMQDRLWEKTIQKISFTPPYEQFYENYPIKPGFFFYKALAYSKYPLEKLQVNIPETFLNIDNAFIIAMNDGVLTKVSDAVYSEFEASLEKRYGFLYDHEKKQDLPYAITRSRGSADYLCAKFVSTLRNLREYKRYSIDNNTLFQRFILPRGMQACIFRLVYFTGNSREKKANYGFRIKNKLHILDENPKISLLQKSTIMTDRPHSFEVHQVTGASLKDYEAPAARLVHFLERSYNVRITKVVVDFMTDYAGVTWLFNLKAIELENVAPILLTIDDAEGKKTLDSLTCSVYCKLCGLIFKKDDASKTLTYKLLWELCQHLKKRGIFLKGINITHNSTRPCRVCDLCYMLAVSEHELIDVEQKFARAQKIPIQDALLRVPIDQKPKHRPALLNEKLNQWRLLIYFHSVNNLEIDSAYFDPKNIQLQYKFYNQKTSFKLFHVPSYEDYHGDDHGYYTLSSKGSPTNAHLKKMMDSRGEINFPRKKKVSGLYMINSMRVHYLFSETTDIQKFLDETEIHLRIVRGDDWNNFFAEGRSTSIKQFKRNWTKSQTHQAQILTFFENGKYCTVKVIFGLVCDGIFNTESMNLYKHNNAYLPDEDFYNSNPFPMEWMEIFEKKDVLINEAFEEKEEEKVYSPKCSPNDIAKMVELAESNPKRPFSAVSSVVKRTWSANKLNQSKSTAAGLHEKTDTQGFKFTTLTDSNKAFTKPRIYSADIRKKQLPSINRDLTLQNQTDNTQRYLQGKQTTETQQEPIDQEYELLSFLTKKGQSNLPPTDKKIGKNHASYLQNFEQQFKYLEDDELIRKYLQEEDSNTPSEKKGTKENPKINIYEPDGSKSQRSDAPNQKGLRESDNNKEAQQEYTHQQFADFLENIKAKTIDPL